MRRVAPLRGRGAMVRSLCSFLVLVAACSCESSDGEGDAGSLELSDLRMPVDGPEPVDEGMPVLGPDGAAGVCCPVGTPSCGCTPYGGWAPAWERCNCASDVRHWTSNVDEWGCPELIADPLTSCLDPAPTYEACTAARGCSGARLCASDESIGDLGGRGDPIGGHPEGEATVVARTLFPDGTCSPSFGGFPEPCDPASPTEACGEGGTCTVLDIGPVCVQACDSDADCREGYRCHPADGACLGPCVSDDECRITRVESNGIEGIQSPLVCAYDSRRCTPADCSDAEPADPEACADPEANFDRLVYDTESTAICDPETLRCVG
jgi:hypothetical protein